MSNEKKVKKERKFVDLKEVCVYRLTVECDMASYADMVQGIESYAMVVKEEIEGEV